MLEMRGVIKTFDGVTALNGLNIQVPQGAVYGLVGPNGAGKSTAIRHLAGILRQDAGEVLLEGMPVFENPAAKRRLAYIPDDVYVFPGSTLREMARFYRRIYPRFDTGRYERLRQIFTFSETRPLLRLSRGMQKQAAFWLALSARPEVLILDEPVDGLDPVMRRRIWQLVTADAAENGTTVLVSSHNLRELEDVCDWVGILHEGRCLLERPLAELQENIVKIRVALPDGVELPPGLSILHRSLSGKLQTLILRGRAEELQERIQAVGPLFMDTLPLSLEEIFIYEVGGAEYGLQDFLL